MLIALCLNIYMANCLRIDIRYMYLLAQSTEHEITLSFLIVSQMPIIIFLSNVVLCGLNAGMHISADDRFNNNNNNNNIIIVIIMQSYCTSDKKINNHVFFYLFISENIICGKYC